MKTDKSSFPITPKYINGMIKDIYTNLKAKANTNYQFDILVGGSHAWIKFILSNRQITDFDKLLKGYKIVLFDVSECIEMSNTEFLYKLYSSICDSINYKHKKSIDSISINEMLDSIKMITDTHINKKSMVIFMPRLDHFKGDTLYVGNAIYSIWKSRKNKIFFVSTIKGLVSRKDLVNMYGDFSEALIQNIKIIEMMDDENIRHSILHWQSLIKYNFDNKQIIAIIKNSKGSLYISKCLCQFIASNNIRDNISKRCQIESEKIVSMITNKEVLITQKNNSIFLGETDLSQFLTYQEFSVLKVLVENAGSVVNRDDIAYSLWGEKSFEKYSDWSIDKYISTIRKKVSDVGFKGSIKVKKGSGFVLNY